MAICSFHQVFDAVDLDHGGDIDVEEFTEFLEESNGDDSSTDGDSDDDETATIGSGTVTPALSRHASMASLSGSSPDILAMLAKEKKRAAAGEQTARAAELQQKEDEKEMAEALKFKEGVEVGLPALG